VLTADPETNAPPFEVEVRYVPGDELNKLVTTRQRQGARRQGAINLQDEYLFRQRFLKKCLANWRGLTKANLRRCSSFALQRPEAVAKLPEELPFTPDHAEELASLLENEYFTLISDEALDLSTYATEILTQEKKDSNASSVSA